MYLARIAAVQLARSGVVLGINGAAAGKVARFKAFAPAGQDALIMLGLRTAGEVQYTLDLMVRCQTVRCNRNSAAA